jgi:hypothetical protein
MEELNPQKNYLFKVENKVLRRAKKGEFTHEELTSSYEELLDQFKLSTKVSKRIIDKTSKIIEEKDIEINDLKKKNKKLNKRQLFLGTCLVLAGITIILTVSLYG